MNRQKMALVSLWVLTTAGPVVGQPATPAPRIEDIRAAWEDRATKVRSCTFEWSQEVLTVKGGDSDGRVGRDGKPIATAPPEDHRYTSPCHLHLDGDKLAFQFTRRFWSADERRYANIPTELKYDGANQLFLNLPGYTQWPDALVRPSGRGPDLPSHVLPLLRAVRGTRPVFRGEDLDEFEVTGAVTTIAGRRVHELTARGGPSHTERHLWIDPARGHVLVRYVLGPAGRPRHQIDIQYQPDSVVGFIPVSWKEVETSVESGRVICTIGAKVSNYRINPELPGSEFRFDLPTGTRVVDETGKGPRRYITLHDGGKRVIRPDEVSKSYQELLDTPGPSGSIWTGYRWWLAGAAGTVGLCLLSTRFWLARRRPSNGPAGDPTSTPPTT